MINIEKIDREDPAIAHDMREFARHYQIPANRVIECWLDKYRPLTRDYQTSDLDVLREEIRKRVRETPDLRMRLDIVSVPRTTAAALAGPCYLKSGGSSPGR